MIYTPDWEELASALQRVVAAGANEPEAKAGICNAVADRKIAVRVTIDNTELHYGGTTLSGGNINVPTRLKPEDFDWVASRPLKRWHVGPKLGQHYFGPDWKHRSVALLELCTADVTAVLCKVAASSPKDLPSPKMPDVEGGVSDQHDERRAFLDAVNRLGPAPMGHMVLCIQPGRGLQGLSWQILPKPGLLLALEWLEFRLAALATNHASLNASDLDGQMIGAAFLDYVINDPKVRACCAWLCYEHPPSRGLLSTPHLEVFFLACTPVPAGLTNGAGRCVSTLMI